MALTKRWFNPIAFTPWPVTVISSLVYIALLVPLLVVQHVVPPAPKTPPGSVNLSEAWADLQHLTSGYHPYNSHRNDEIRSWLLKRIHEILDSAGVAHKDVGTAGVTGAAKSEVFVFDDTVSNLTFAGSGVGIQPVTGVYFEGMNIMVYIRGTEDDQEDWWEKPDGKPKGRGGVLVNAHYDSVSTGFGATDDGVGVVSVLQLIRYFTSPGHQPRKGLVLLLNNGEEDFLNGARAYSQHPLSRFTHTFLNLEGAGAGGRAALFRTTDTEVTKFYKNAEHPFGSVLADDGFKLGLIRSETDYVIFNGVLGLRGLDVAFIGPRSRYHTDQDDVRHTNVDSVWHMLSGAIGTTEGLVSYKGDAFDSPTSEKGKINSGVGTRGVWFDLFGSTFAVFRLHTLFAISVTMLVVAPLVLLGLVVALVKADKMYLFSRYKTIPETDERVGLQGLRGLFRYPILLAIASLIPVGLAYLLTKFNPYIIHSSSYAVWSMMISSWIFLAWFVSCVADFVRPSALQRAYSFTWMFLDMWIQLVASTVYQNQREIASGYFIMFYFAAVFAATFVSYVELFALPKKGDYAREQRGEISPARTRGIEDDNEQEEEEPTESTSLLGGHQRTTFANYTRAERDLEPSDDFDSNDGKADPNVYGHEQAWSAKLPKWTWLVQLLFLAPIVLMFVGQLALFLTEAMSQVGPDGTAVFTVYIGIAAFTTLLLMPLSPFIHRLTYHIPIFLLFVFISTLIYNLIAFPFSAQNRAKLFFLQEMDLDNGKNQVSLIGIQPFVKDVIHTIPSSTGKDIKCDPPLKGRHKCSWEGLPPRVVGNIANGLLDTPYESWVAFNISKSENKPQARFHVSGKNTRACKLKFDSPVANYSIRGSSLDERMPHTVPQGISEIRLWSRTWENTWTIDVEWDDKEKKGDSKTDLQGKVICLWSDYNQLGVIPALDEIRLYAPAWVAVPKFSDALVEGGRGFTIRS